MDIADANKLVLLMQQICDMNLMRGPLPADGAIDAIRTGLTPRAAVDSAYAVVGAALEALEPTEKLTLIIGLTSVFAQILGESHVSGPMTRGDVLRLLGKYMDEDDARNSELRARVRVLIKTAIDGKPGEN